MEDSLGSSEFVFYGLNHSFDPNLKCTPYPEDECVVFETLRKVRANEPLCFDYTTTEESKLANPFVDLVTGEKVGF